MPSRADQDRASQITKVYNQGDRPVTARPALEGRLYRLMISKFIIDFVPVQKSISPRYNLVVFLGFPDFSNGCAFLLHIINMTIIGLMSNLAK